MKKILSGSILFVLLAGLLFSCQQKNILNDMARLDSKYIPVLALTRHGKVGASQKAFATLQKTWTAFNNSYRSYQKDDSLWAADFDSVDALIKETAKIMNSGKDIQEAHETLEGVRMIFMNLRHRHHWTYFPDNLLRFHRPMEMIIHKIVNTKADSLTDQDMQIIKVNLKSAQQLWQALEKAPFNAQRFGFAPQKIKKMKKIMKDQDQTFKQVMELVEKNDRQNLVKEGMNIKANFAKMFMLFGDFPKMK